MKNNEFLIGMLLGAIISFSTSQFYKYSTRDLENAIIKYNICETLNLKFNDELRIKSGFYRDIIVLAKYHSSSQVKVKNVEFSIDLWEDCDNLEKVTTSKEALYDTTGTNQEAATRAQ